jgi:ATP synthase protein I
VAKPAVRLRVDRGTGITRNENGEDATMTDDRDEGLEQRRAQLGAELANKRAAVREDERGEVRAEESRKGYAQAMKLSSEFIAAIIVGAVLGYVLDRFLGTTPWGMIILLLLGFCAGVLNVLRSAGKVATPEPQGREPGKK